VRNPHKAAFINEVYTEFMQLFPKSVAAMDFTRAGAEPTPDERKDAFLDVSCSTEGKYQQLT
jgi:hypothetical protein